MSNEMIPAAAGALQGFPRTYPWRGTKQQIFLQIADVVLPPIASRILTALTHPTTAAHQQAA